MKFFSFVSVYQWSLTISENVPQHFSEGKGSGGIHFFITGMGEGRALVQDLTSNSVFAQSFLQHKFHCILFYAVLSVLCHLPPFPHPLSKLYDYPPIKINYSGFDLFSL